MIAYRPILGFHTHPRCKLTYYPKARTTDRGDPIRQRICATVDSIPRGCVATYGQIALEADLPRRARLVGRVLRDLPPRSRLPWHRVITAAGRISVRPGNGARLQRERLVAEGVAVDAQGRVDLARHRWRP